MMSFYPQKTSYFFPVEEDHFGCEISIMSLFGEEQNLVLKESRFESGYIVHLEYIQRAFLVWHVFLAMIYHNILSYPKAIKIFSML